VAILTPNTVRRFPGFVQGEEVRVLAVRHQHLLLDAEPVGNGAKPTALDGPADNHPKVERDIAVRNRAIVAAKTTPARIAEALKLAREWKPKPKR